jgi:hypothetical protein
MNTTTPTPWTLNREHAGGEYRWEVEGANGMSVCGSDLSGDVIPGEIAQIDADFALITAAPALRAVCRYAYGKLSDGLASPDEIDAVCEALAAVLAQSKGDPA